MLEYNGWTKEKLRNFGDEIVRLYETGIIKAPIHLSHGQEDGLIKIFSDYKINKDTWICATWRSHYAWLLSGRNPEELKKQILDGRSMHVYGHKFITSSIVGGIAPIATGIAYALKEKNSNEKVFCFLGDMGISTGISIESVRYSSGHALPVVFVVEDNGLSVRAKTLECWGTERGQVVCAYKYTREKPHAGVGHYVMF